jgi:hypothetical protein
LIFLSSCTGVFDLSGKPFNEYFREQVRESVAAEAVDERVLEKADTRHGGSEQ